MNAKDVRKMGLINWRDTLAKAERYYETDPFDIEEVLSFLEVNGFLEGRTENEVFVTYIKDVIKPIIW